MKLLASVSPGEMRVAAWDGRLCDYAIHRPGAPDGVGDLHRGRVIARVPAMAGAFVMLDGAEGFLPDSEGAAGAGTMLGVRVTRAAQGGKGPRLSARLSAVEQTLIGTGSPALLKRGPDALQCLAWQYPDAPILIDDAAAAARAPRPANLVPRAFDDDVETAVEVLGEAEAPLPGGARMHIHPTPALIAIDVDLGSASSDARGKQAAQHEANRALLPALAHQIRLRNLSGAILVDLAGMTARKRVVLASAFAAALAPDPLAPRFLGFTALGLAEILRSRIHPPLHEVLSGPHAAALCGLRALARAIAATPHHPPRITVGRAVAQALHEDAIACAAFADGAGRSLVIDEDPRLPALAWRI